MASKTIDEADLNQLSKLIQKKINTHKVKRVPWESQQVPISKTGIWKTIVSGIGSDIYKSYFDTTGFLCFDNTSLLRIGPTDLAKSTASTLRITHTYFSPS